MKNRANSTKEFKTRCKNIIIALDPIEQLSINLFELSAKDLPKRFEESLLSGTENMLFIYDLLFSNKYKNFRDTFSAISPSGRISDGAILTKRLIDNISALPKEDYRLIRLYLLKNKRMNEVAKKLNITKKEAYDRFYELVKILNSDLRCYIDEFYSKDCTIRPMSLTDVYGVNYLDLLLAIAKLEDEEIRDVYRYFNNNLEKPGAVKFDTDLQYRYSSGITQKLAAIINYQKGERDYNYQNDINMIIDTLSEKEKSIVVSYYNSGKVEGQTPQIIKKVNLIYDIMYSFKFDRLRKRLSFIFVGARENIIKRVKLLIEIINTFDSWQVAIFNAYFASDEQKTIYEVAKEFNYSEDVIEDILGNTIKYIEDILPKLADYNSTSTIESIYKTFGSYMKEDVLRAIFSLSSDDRRILFEVHGFNLDDPNPVDIELVPYTTYAECILPKLRTLLEKQNQFYSIEGSFINSNNEKKAHMIMPISDKMWKENYNK